MNWPVDKEDRNATGNGSVNDARSIADELMAGAIDLHAHGYPEVSLSYKGRVTDVEWANAAQALHMGGFVMKSHVWPTMDRAFALQQQFPGLRIMGSLTLNPNVGGLSPWAVESAVQLGAKALWLPTWGARFDMEHHGGKYFRSHLPSLANLAPAGGISLLDEGGDLRDEAMAVLEVAKDADLLVGTGHISPLESLKVAFHCKDIGFRKLIFTHPIILGASTHEIERMAELGSYIEFTCLHVMLSVVQVSAVIDIIKKIGHQKCLLTTDAFFDWTPPAPEMLRLWIGLLMHNGLPADMIRAMVHHNTGNLFA